MVVETLPVPGFYESAADGCVFVDDGGLCELRVKLPAGVDASGLDARDVVLRAGEESLCIELRGSGVLVDCKQLHSAIRASETTWTIDREARELVVFLSKVEEDEPWRGLGRDEPEEGDAATALEQREKVKQLLQSTREGSADVFDSFVQNLADGSDDFNLGQVKDANAKNVLHFAAQFGNLPLCKHVVDKYAFAIDTRDSEGETALSLACGAHQTDVVAFLLSKGASVAPSQPNATGPTHRSALAGDERSLSLLLEQGADADARSDLGTPLFCAAGAGHADCVSLLVGRGCDPDIPDAMGVTPVMAAAACGDERSARCLLDQGCASADARAENGATALHIAASAGDAPLVSLLLSHGADPAAKDKDGLMAIHAAAVCERRAALGVLLPVTPEIAGVRWDEDGLIAHARERDGFVEDFSMDAGGPPGVEALEAGIAELEVKDREASLELKTKGDQAYREGDYTKAADLYTQSIDNDPTNALSVANRSACLLQLGQFAPALADAKMARVLKPDYVKAYFREGSAHVALGEFEQAAQAFFEGCRLDPDNMEMTRCFQDAVAKGREQHKAQQEQITN